MQFNFPFLSHLRPVLLGTLAAVVIAVAILLLSRSDDPLPVAGPQGCDTSRNQVAVEFDGPSADADMQAAAELLGRHEQVAAIWTQDRQQAFEEFKQRFKDQNELVKLARPEALPASVWVLTTSDVTAKDLAGRIQPDLPNADRIRPDACDPAS